MVQQIVGELTLSRWRLYAAVIIANLLFVSTGCVLTWPSPVLPKLQLAENEGSWISSVASLGAAVVPLFNSIAMSHVGRKKIMLANGLLFLISWAVLMAGTNFASMIVGRILAGLGVGLSFICVPLYITEAADDEVRQAVTSLTELFIGIGYLIIYGLGPYLTYFQLQVAASIAVIVFFIPAIFLPESPHYFISKGKRENAAKSLAWFRGLELNQVDQELDIIQESFSYMKDKEGEKSMMDVIKKKGYRKAFLFGLAVLFIQQMSGICVVTSFTEPILSAAHLPFPAFIGAILFGVVNLFSSALAPPLVRRFGSKRVLILCNFVMAVSLYAYAIYMYCNLHGVDVRVVNLLPVISLVVYNIFFCIGGGPLPWSLIAELSPPEFRGFNCCVIAMFCWLVSFVLIQAWAPVSVSLGEWAVFGFFASFLTIGTIFIIIALPDTRGMSLAQVQLLLAGKEL